jgi:hypothetical protein
MRLPASSGLSPAGATGTSLPKRTCLPRNASDGSRLVGTFARPSAKELTQLGSPAAQFFCGSRYADDVRPLVILCAVALAASGVAQGDAKTQLQARYNALAAAFAKGDIGLYAQTLAPEYELHMGPRTQKKDAILKDFKRQMANMKNSKWTRLVTKTTPKEGKVQVTVKSTFNGDFDAKGKMTHFYNEATSLDTWTKLGGKWQLVESTLVSLDAKLDGKPAGHFPEKG